MACRASTAAQNEVPRSEEVPAGLGRCLMGIFGAMGNSQWCLSEERVLGEAGRNPESRQQRADLFPSLPPIAISGKNSGELGFVLPLAVLLGTDLPDLLLPFCATHSRHPALLGVSSLASGPGINPR